MALVLENITRSAIADAVDDTINIAGPGTLQFQTAASAEVATITFSNPVFGDAENGVITADVDPALSDTTAEGGVMTKFVINNGTPALVLTGTVSTSNADINFAGGTTVGVGDTVTISSLTITCPSGA